MRRTPTTRTAQRKTRLSTTRRACFRARRHKTTVKTARGRGVENSSDSSTAPNTHCATLLLLPETGYAMPLSARSSVSNKGGGGGAPTQPSRQPVAITVRNPFRMHTRPETPRSIRPSSGLEQLFFGRTRRSNITHSIFPKSPQLLQQGSNLQRGTQKSTQKKTGVYYHNSSVPICSWWPLGEQASNRLQRPRQRGERRAKKGEALP